MIKLKFSTKARYGLRVLIILGVYYNKKLLQIKDIAEREDLTEKYLEQIFISLKAANFVKSVRGAKGGYYLSKNPSEITIREIIERLEGSLFPTDCAENSSVCSRSFCCVTTDLWKELGNMIYQFLENKTLRDLVDAYENKNQFNIQI